MFVIDLDGVLRRWDASVFEQAEHRHGLPVGTIGQVAFDPDRLRAAVTGLVSDGQWRADVADELAARFGSSAELAVREWSQSVGTVDEAVLAIVDAQRRQRPVAVLTNATSRLRADLSRLGLDGHVDHVFNSSELGVAKPDPGIFELVAEQLDVAPDHCLFVDDTAANVAAAEAVGWSAHRYRSAPELQQWLNSGRPFG